MAEKHYSPEHHNHTEHQPDAGREHEILKHKHEKALEAERERPSAEQARTAIDKLATPISREAARESSESSDNGDGMRWMSSELRGQAFDRILSSVRHRLSKPDKQFSKIVHQPIVDRISDVAGKTVVRPSGVLLGSVFSFIGSLVAYLLARRLGGDLQHSVFAAFFLGGFALGLIVEFVWRTFRLRRAR